ncbi:SDR family oxidoreductase [Candidatus Beckwithbacteria bacterium]|nr:SDR family oxidoreductase [Candidatus Beckwithbacteria bacterium]
MSLKNKTILISGGNSGLGFEISKQLIRLGSKVIILGKNQNNLNLAVKKLKSPFASSMVCDLTNAEEIEKLNIGKLDILINCAGVIKYSPLEKHSITDIKNIIDTNLIGTILLTRQVLPILKKQNSGIIVNISSTSGLMTGGHAYESVYIASKFGVTGFTESLKKEMAEEGKNIKVLGFYPGGMNTPLFTKSGEDKDTTNFMDPAEIAKILVFMLQQPDAVSMDHIVVNRNKTAK